MGCRRQWARGTRRHIRHLPCIDPAPRPIITYTHVERHRPPPLTHTGPGRVLPRGRRPPLQRERRHRRCPLRHHRRRRLRLHRVQGAAQGPLAACRTNLVVVRTADLVAPRALPCRRGRGRGGDAGGGAGGGGRGAGNGGGGEVAGEVTLWQVTFPLGLLDCALHAVQGLSPEPGVCRLRLLYSALDAREDAAKGWRRRSRQCRVGPPPTATRVAAT